MLRDRSNSCIFIFNNWIDAKNPSLDSIHIEDVAYGLARTYRWNGRTIKPFSVAQHSVLVKQYMDSVFPSISFEALMHDASEAYIGDMQSGLKKLCPDFQNIEKAFKATIDKKYFLDDNKTIRVTVHYCDIAIRMTEARDLVGWPTYNAVRSENPDIEPYGSIKEKDIWLPYRAEHEFLKVFYECQKTRLKKVNGNLDMGVDLLRQHNT